MYKLSSFDGIKLVGIILIAFDDIIFIFFWSCDHLVSYMVALSPPLITRLNTILRCLSIDTVAFKTYP
jgi:hypothetical protein